MFKARHQAWLVGKRTSGFKRFGSNTAFLKHAMHALEHMDNSDGLIYCLKIFMALQSQFARYPPLCSSKNGCL